MRICLTCSAENDNDAHRCRVCNGAFLSEIIDAAGEDAQRRLVCSGCGSFISAVGYVCPHCGHSIEDTVADTRTVRHLKLKHSSGAEILAGDGDVLGRGFAGKVFFSRDAYVSTSHIKVSQAGRFFVFEDISSGNAFFVNMQPIPERGTAVVKPGDVVKIGVNDFVVDIFV